MSRGVCILLSSEVVNNTDATLHDTSTQQCDMKMSFKDLRWHNTDDVDQHHHYYDHFDRDQRYREKKREREREKGRKSTITRFLIVLVNRPLVE